MEQERLDKLIAGQSTTLSRRDVKALVRKGLIFVNGAAAAAPDMKISEEDEVLVNGKPLRIRKHVYIMLNKPAGVLCAIHDKHCRTVLELVPPELRRAGLFPAGRLDKDTEGFVLLTDDGAFAHRILSPKSHVPKTYFVVLDREIDPALCTEFAAGVALDGGDVTSPAQLAILRNGARPEVELVIYEGMYHQVKRMFQRFSLEVLYLKRVKMGGLALDKNLPLGCCKEILHKELEQI